MKIAIETIDKEIKNREEELSRLKTAKSILLRGNTKTEIAFPTVKKYKKRKSYMKWTQIEIRQLIDLYNRFSHFKQKRRMNKLVGKMGMKTSRISNKLWELRKDGLIK